MVIKPWHIIVVLVVVAGGLLAWRMVKRSRASVAVSPMPADVRRPLAPPQRPAVAAVTPSQRSETPPGTPSALFVSYRRADSAHAAHRLYDYLTERFGRESVFIDLDTIAPGVDFVNALEDAVRRCKVLLAIIGPGWVAAADANGAPRLADPNDLVRLEIENALRRQVTVIPVLIDTAEMPGAADLPDSIALLVRRNAYPIRLSSFHADSVRLGDHLAVLLASA
jgi:TIR domain